MELSNIQYFNDQFEDDLKAFFCDGMIGLQNLKSGKKTIPCFEHFITSPKYIFVKAEDSWGVLDKDLCLLLPPIYKEIFPVKKIDRDSYINSCLLKDFDSTFIFNADGKQPTHIAIQTVESDWGRPKFMALDAFIDDYLNGPFKEEDKADIYEITYDYEHLETSLFVLVSKDGKPRLIKMNNETQNRRKIDIFFLWHYKESTFMHRDNKAYFGFCTYRGGRFFREPFIRPKQGDRIIVSSPHIRFHKNDFVSVCLPDITKHVGNTTYSNEKLCISGKWALYRYNHRRTGFAWEDKEESYFQQQTPFAFTEPLFQTHDGFGFICREMSKEWLVRYDSEKKSLESTPHITDEDSEKAATLVDEYMHSTYKPALLDGFVNICFKGALKIASSFFDSIECREDGMYDISTDEGYGLCDENMKVIVPTKYDYPIEWDEQIMVVAKKGKYGAINTNAEEIVPCRYEYIQVGKGEMRIWDWDCEWDNTLVDTVDKCTIKNKVEIISSDEDLSKDGYIIVGITIEKTPMPSKLSEPQNLFEKLHNFVAQTQKPRIIATHCDIYSPSGQYLTNCEVGKLGVVRYSKEIGTIVVNDRSISGDGYKRYGIYIGKNTCPIMTSDELTDDIQTLSGNSSEGFYDLQKIVITKDVTSVEWNGLGRYKFYKFEVSPENAVFCEHEGVLYTKKGYDRNGKMNRKRMIELVACPSNVTNHNVIPGTIRIANCAFKGSNVEKLSLPDSLEEIGVNAFYLANQIKELEIPLSIRKIESQDVGKSGATSPTIKYDGHVFLNWEDLYVYMCEHGFERRYG